MHVYFSKRNTNILIGIVIGLTIGILALVSLKQTRSPEAQPEQKPPVTGAFDKAVKRQTVIGTSVEGRDIEAYTYGNGDTHLLFVGGIHGGYEWNSVVLSYRLIDYLEAQEETLPENITITVIPSLNPDGVYAVVQKEGRFSSLDVNTKNLQEGTGRFNAHNVDLNRNFACKWQPESTWRGNIVSAGNSAFSEPEALALKLFVETHSLQLVVFFHSQSNAIYASECEEGVLPETRDIMNAYSLASGYKAIESFDAYPITGDAEGWLASLGIPAITVELSSHEAIEWEQNLAGVQALITRYAN